MNRYRLSTLAIVLIGHLMLIGISLGDLPDDTREPVYIGVLLPLTGPDGKPMLDAIQLATAQINAGGGIGGRLVDLILRDTRTGDIEQYAREMAADNRIRVVIGPFSSDELFQVSEPFIERSKVLVSPTASSDEIFRAFATTGSVWRTLSNDGEITSVIMQHLSGHGARSVAILTPASSYGKTFWDWIPYWAIETRIGVTGAEEYARPDQIPGAVLNLTRQHPDYLILVHSGANEELSLAINALKNAQVSTRLYLVNPNMDKEGRIMERMNSSSLFSTIVSGQWILQNSSVSTTKVPEDTLLMLPGPIDPEFSREVEEFSGSPASGYAAQAYDAMLVSSGIMARFLNNPEKSPKAAAQVILRDNGAVSVPRTVQGFQTSFTRIMNNESVVMTGATGPLTFRPEGTDRLIPSFETARISEGLLVSDPLVYQELQKGNSTVTEEYSDDGGSDTGKYSQENYWAVIGALSRDWKNYRHQADALTIYQYIREQGVPDDHIILLVYDDIYENARNVKPGEVYHTPGVMEVRKLANPDYIGDQVNKQMLKDIFLGSGKPGMTNMLGSDEHSTVLVYLSSHGTQGGFMVLGDGEDVISPKEFTDIIEKMAENKKFGRMLVILESCFSRATAAGIHTPGVVVMTAASADETSKAAVYDSEIANWLSDEYTNQIISLLLSGDPGRTLGEFFHEVSMSVRSSHPAIIRGNSTLNTPVALFFGGE